jgi:hypothetical protein
MTDTPPRATFVRTLTDWLSGTARLYRLDRPVPYRRPGDDYDGPHTGRADHLVVSYASGVDETVAAASNADGHRLAWFTEIRGRDFPLAARLAGVNLDD